MPGRLVAAYESVAQKGLAKNEVVIDRELDMAEVPFAHRELKKLAPFGIGNEKPLFVVPRVTIGNAKMFGKAQEHLDLRLTNGATSVSGISFFAKPSNFTKQVSVGDTADVVGHVETDWRGQPRVRVVDII